MLSLRSFVLWASSASLCRSLSLNGCGKVFEMEKSYTSDRTLLIHDPQLGPVNRTYRLFVPAGEAPRGGSPLLLGFHGQGHSPSDWAPAHHFDEYADQHKWIVAYPAGMADGFDSGWNCGTASDNSTCLPGTKGTSCHDSCQQLKQCGSCAWSTCYDDVAFIDQLIEALEDEFCLNRSAYFLVGESNGGMLMHHIVQQRPGKFLGAAIAFALPLMGYLVGSNFQLLTQSALASRTSILSVYPRSDTTIPWRGGRSGDGWLYENRDKTLGVWAALHGCSPMATHEESPYAGGSKQLECFGYSQCESGGRVSYCMYDGGHGGWPDQPAADSMMWAFFTSLLGSREADNSEKEWRRQAATREI